MTIRFLVISGLTLILAAGCSTAPKRTITEQAVKTNDSSIPEPSSNSNVSQKPADSGKKTDAKIEKDPVKRPKNSTPPAKKLSDEEREKLVNHFLEAAILEEKNRFDDAGKAYAKAMNIAPDSSYLGAMAGKAQLQSGNVDKAIQIAQNAIKNGSEETEAYKVLGLAYRQKKDFAKAIEQYKKLVEIDPKSLDNLNELVTLYVRSHQFDEAIDIYKKMAQLNIHQAFMYHYRIALILTQQSRHQEALEEYQKVAEQVPNNFDVYLQMGKLHELLQQPDDAILTYLKAIQFIRNERDELNVRNSLASLYTARESKKEAIHQYRRIKELAPEDTQASMQLARLNLALENYPEALKELDELAESIPDNFFIAVLRLQTLEKLQRGAEAYQGLLHGFKHAIALENEEEMQRFLVELTRKSTWTRIHEYAQDSYMHQLLEKCAALFPMQPRPIIAAAKIASFEQNKAEENKQFENLLALIQKSLDENAGKELPFIMLELRSWYDVRRNLSQSIYQDDLCSLLQKCQEKFPEISDYDRTLAQVYMDNNRWMDAETQLQNAKEKLEAGSQNHKDTIYQLALVYEKMDRLADIEALMNEAIETYPEDSQGYNFLGYTYADRNIRLDDALLLIQKALKLGPDDGNTLDSMGWVYYRMGRLQDAVSFLEKAIQLEENHPVILDHLGDTRQKLGDYETAISCWKRALEFGPDFPYDFTPEFKQRVTQKLQEAEETIARDRSNPPASR